MVVADVCLAVHGWTWEYVDETLTPSRLRALRKAAKIGNDGVDKPQSGPPPMNAAELVRWIDQTGGKIPGVGPR